MEKTKDAITLEQKIETIVSNKEPIKDGAPEIFTERKDGVIPAYDIRTDRWEIAAEAMDVVEANMAAKRDAMHIVRDGGEIDENGKKIEPPKGDVEGGA